MLTKAQIGSWSDTQWSDPEYDRLYAEQQTTIDPEARKQIIWKMQQIAYDQSPYITLTYPEWLESYNDGQWTGWVRTPVRRRPRDLHAVQHRQLPVRGAEAGRGGGRERGGGSTTVIVVATIAVVVAAIVTLVVVRRRRRAVEE